MIQGGFIVKKFLTAFLLLIIIMSPIQAKAEDKSYTIDKLTENAQILKNGDVVVREELTYNFTGSFNGFYRDLIKKGSSGFSVSDISVIDKNNKTMQLTHSGSSENNTYQILDSSDKTQLKLFVKSSNERKTFIINYIIHGAAVKNKSYGEFYWNFYNVENNIPIKDVELNLSLKSSPFDLNHFKYWTYVDDKDFTTNYDPNGIHIKGNILTSLLGVKVQFQQSYLDIEETSDSILGILIPSIIIILIGGFLIYMFYRKKKNFIAALDKYRSQYIFFDGKLLSSAPQDISPALLNLLCFEKCSNALPSTLLYLSQKGYYKLEETPHPVSGVRDENDISFIRDRKIGMPASPHLKFLVEWMSHYEKGNILSLKAIEHDVSIKNGASNFQSKLYDWKDIIKKEADKLGFYINIEDKKVLSNEYYDQQLRWNAYKRYLEQQIQSEISSLTTDNITDLLIYASILNIGSDYLENFSNKLKQMNQETNNYSFNFWNYYLLSSYNTEIWNNIDDNIHHNTTTNNDNFGGFSGGGDFSGGGGGGSGAF